jgi:hypothetical protein
MRAICAILLSLPLVSCTQGAYTGLTVTTNTEGATVPLNGRSDKADAGVDTYVLADPNGNPWAGTPAVPLPGMTQIAHAVTGSTAYYQNDPTHPYYDWSTTSDPLSAGAGLFKEWRQGGLLHLRVRSKYSTNANTEDMIAFDLDSAYCWQSEVVNAGQSWLTGITDCQSPYPINSPRAAGGGHDIITMVSTFPTPANQHNDEMNYLGYSGARTPPSPPAAPSVNQAKTANYYTTINAPLTFSGSGGFKEKYGFGLAGTDEVSAIYYNAGDLGVARDMHCKSFIPPQTVPPRSRPVLGRACYVTNYGRDSNGVVVFGAQNDSQSLSLDPQVAIAQAISGPGAGSGAAIATVCMVYYPPLPLALVNSVQFMVYNAAGGIGTGVGGARLDYAALDNRGIDACSLQGDTCTTAAVAAHANINVPDNCLTCHGASSKYEIGSNGKAAVDTASFLPFDAAGFVFSTTNSAYSQANMAPKLKALNAHVAATAPNPAVLDLLNGMYPSTLNPPGANGPAAVDTVFDDTYVPSGWKSAGKGPTQLYTEVVKPYCRTCHLSYVYNSSNSTRHLEFLSFAQFNGESPAIGDYVCKEGQGPMPQAEQTQTRFWKSSARAHLVNAFKITGSCAPCFNGVNTTNGECKPICPGGVDPSTGLCIPCPHGVNAITGACNP